MWTIRVLGTLFVVALALVFAAMEPVSRVESLKLLWPALLSAVVGLVMTDRSFAHLSDRGRKHPLSVLFRGTLAGREEFSERGCRYRQWSIVAGVLGFVASAFLILFSR